jgi:8-oxo-dGTP pyrophosphatase MutT (NUDIX family)
MRRLVRPCHVAVAAYAARVTAWIERLAKRITPGDARPNEDEGRYAAVAVLLHEEPLGPRVLLMKRAEREGDPWSGHISLPGGGYEKRDRDLLQTAIRETQEELGIDLAGARLIGKLPPMHPRTSGPKGIEVTPFVFVTDVAVEPQCGPEAMSAFWLPLELAASGQLDGTYTYPNTEMAFPSWTYEGHVIWGLTLRILGDVLAASR